MSYELFIIFETELKFLQKYLNNSYTAHYLSTYSFPFIACTEEDGTHTRHMTADSAGAGSTRSIGTT